MREDSEAARIVDGASQELIEEMVEQCERGPSAHAAQPGLVTWYAEPVAGERRITVDQTNTSVVVGERAVVKWLLAPQRGRHPAPERLGLLVAAGFAQTPRPWGLRYDDGALRAIVTEFLPGAVDGWEWAPAMVRSLARSQLSMAQACDPVFRIGELVGRMHNVFAGSRILPATQEQADTWYAGACSALEAARAAMSALVGDAAPETSRIAALMGKARAVLGALRHARGTPLILVHGDLHVGQILRQEGSGQDAEFNIIDFDGNPVLSLQDRLAPQPAAVDVAGMLCSIDHVGRVVIHRTPEVDSALVLAWIDAAEEAFRTGYRSTASDPATLDEALIPALRVQQECREYLYAAAHLPHWRYVPHAALPALLARITLTEGETDGS